jgi:hypothetical protein
MMTVDLGTCFAGIAAGRVTGVARVASPLEPLHFNVMAIHETVTPPALPRVTDEATGTGATLVTPVICPGVATVPAVYPRQNSGMRGPVTPATHDTPFYRDLAALWDAFQERAALMTFEGALPAVEAERLAFEDVLSCWLREHLPLFRDGIRVLSSIPTGEHHEHDTA